LVFDADRVAEDTIFGVWVHDCYEPVAEGLPGDYVFGCYVEVEESGFGDSWFGDDAAGGTLVDYFCSWGSVSL